MALTLLAYFLMLVNLVYFGYMMGSRFIHVINGPSFVRRIMQAVGDNEFERAIRICESEPQSLLAQTTLQMIQVANKVYSLELYYQLGVRRLRNASSGCGISNTLFLISFLAYMIPIHTSETRETLPVLVGVLVLSLINVLVNIRWRAHMEFAEVFLLEFRGLLYYRAHWYPPHLRPSCKLSKEEFIAWEDKLEEIAGKAKAEGKTPEEVLGEELNPDGGPPDSLLKLEFK